MTLGRARLDPQESIYDNCKLILFDLFRWDDRAEVYACLKRILAPPDCCWQFGGAYIFWQVAPTSEVLYIGETDRYTVRLKAHLLGPRRNGNKHGPLFRNLRRNGESPRSCADGRNAGCTSRA